MGCSFLGRQQHTSFVHVEHSKALQSSGVHWHYAHFTDIWINNESTVNKRIYARLAEVCIPKLFIFFDKIRRVSSILSEITIPHLLQIISADSGSVIALSLLHKEHTFDGPHGYVSLPS
jgi:hypothetical protein